jgi:hypothetical protein
MKPLAVASVVADAGVAAAAELTSTFVRRH